MIEVTASQFTLVGMVFSFTAGAMGVASLFFFCQRTLVLPRYQTSVTLLCLVCAFACYSYIRLLGSWDGAFVLQSGVLRATGLPYNEMYRYLDWLLNVPLLLTALVLVLDIPAKQARVRSVVLGLLAAESVVLGYIGIVARTPDTRWLWFAGAMVPFILILYQLFVTMRAAVAAEPPVARGWVTTARFVLVLTWSFYPVVYALPLLGITGGQAFLIGQVGYAVADLAAKALFGAVLCLVATSKSVPALGPVMPSAGLPQAAGRTAGAPPRQPAPQPVAG